MFNLSNLITSCMLATGVATTTPVNHANNLPSTQQAQNVITDYSITLQQIGTTSIANYNDVRPSNVLGVSNYVVDNEQVKNYSATTNYLHVIATSYDTQINYTPQGSSETYKYLANYAYCQNNDPYETSTRYLIVCQIDAYNYNVNTETEITLTYDFEGWQTPIDGDWITPDADYIQKNVYQTTEDWAQYIQRQNAKLQAITIKNDIENVNNNFYYTKNTTTYPKPGNADTTTINLVPKTKNYLVIEYIPIIEMVYYDYGLDQEIDTSDISNLPLKATTYTYSPLTFNGTNIIPDGTYEVIDIPGLMWEILTMPFSFVSQAFNLTLFPGTPYQLNISNLFLSIIAVVVFVWLISFFLKLKG